MPTTTSAAHTAAASVRLRCGLQQLGDGMVNPEEGLLLHAREPRLPDCTSATTASTNGTATSTPGRHTLPDYSALDAATATAPAPAAVRLRGGLQLLVDWLVRAEEGVVLHEGRQGLPYACTTSTTSTAASDASAPSAGSIRLRRRVWQLGGWVVSGQEGLVLQTQRQRLFGADHGLRHSPAPGRTPIWATGFRLQRWL